jgi:UDP-glucose 4-epimerase
VSHHRVLVTGMGGELGVRVANLLAAAPDVEAVRGIDLDPPRLRTHGVEFVRVDPRERGRVVPVVRDFEPTIVVHLGVYEPNARTGPQLAAELNELGTLHAVGAAAECASLERVVVRSGIEVYGRRRGQASRPDETVVPDPTSGFGRQLRRVEELAIDAGRAAGAPVTALRLAPVTGSAMASPLGRYLRLPVVAFGALGDLPFSLLHQTDAAMAVMAAIGLEHDGPVNVVAEGVTTPAQAAFIGGRIPLPILGFQWQVARVAAELLGAPLPDHVRELLTRGRAADGGAAADVLGLRTRWTTRQIVRDLYDWAPVTYVHPDHQAVA